MEQMLYLSQWFNVMTFTEALKGNSMREWVIKELEDIYEAYSNLNTIYKA